MVIATSCWKLHRIEGNHELATEIRHVTGFTEVHNSSEFDVYIEQDSVFEIKIEAEENLLPYIDTDLHQNSLDIEVKRGRDLKCHFPIKVFVKGPYFTEISMSGSGNIECDTLYNSNISFELSGSGNIRAIAYSDDTDASISGSGNIELSGTSQSADYRISGSGKIKSYSMETGNCFCNISGSGDMYVFATNLLDVIISGNGTVHYLGNPQITTSITGSGSIIHN